MVVTSAVLVALGWVRSQQMQGYQFSAASAMLAAVCYQWANLDYQELSLLAVSLQLAVW